MTTTIDLPSQLASELDALAASENKTRDEVVRDLLSRQLLLHKRRETLKTQLEKIPDVADFDPELHEALRRNSIEMLRRVEW